MAPKASFFKYTRAKVQQAKTKKAKEEGTKGLLVAPKVSFWGWIIVVWFAEDAFKHLPPHERKGSISQWGPLVAFALFLVGFFLRCLGSALVDDTTNPNRTKFQKEQNAAAVGLIKPHDVELGIMQPSQAHVAGN